MDEYWNTQNATQQEQVPQPEPPAITPAAKKSRKGLKITALTLCCTLLGSLIGAGSAFLGFLHLRKQEAAAEEEARLANSTTILVGDRETKPLMLAQIDTGTLMTPAEVYASNVNSTVGITTSVTTNFWGFQTTSAASGSGFILTEDGYILTNYHVIEGSNSITVTLYDGTSYDARIIGYDESLDTAILKVDAEDLVPVVLGNSDQINVGDSVLAIGNPLGELTFSLTAGAVSALDREVTMSNGVTMDLIQTDCAINSGNSGGALFNLYGEVIGITNAKYSGSGRETSIDNIGFAIPINDVMHIIQSIIEKGYLSKPFIGVYLTDVTQELQRYGLPLGAAVVEVMADSPAEAAGLMANDIITKANKTKITCADDLGDLISACSVGDILNLTVYRQGETLQITLEVGEQIQSATEQSAAEQEQQSPSLYPGYFGNGS